MNDGPKEEEEEEEEAYQAFRLHIHISPKTFPLNLFEEKEHLYKINTYKIRNYISPTSSHQLSYGENV